MENEAPKMRDGNLEQGTEDWKQYVLTLVQIGEYGQAANWLQERIERSSHRRSRRDMAAELILLLVKQSRYGEAYAQALTAEEDWHLRPSRSWITVAVAHLLIFVFLLGAAPIQNLTIRFFKRLLRTPADFGWHHANGLLWGVYWQRLPHALYYNIQCCFTALQTQSLRSFAFLAYTLSLQGYTKFGLLGLEKAIARSRRLGTTDLERDLLVWLGVAYQWSGRPDQCLQVHAEFDQRFPEVDPFLKIISHASRLHSAFTDRGPTATAEAVERCSQISVALKESRNHIQIYAAKAALLALEGRDPEALVFLDKARSATERNANHLDWIIFHRMAAVVYLNMGNNEATFESVGQVKHFLNCYGFPEWYVMEAARLRCIAAINTQPGSLVLRWLSASRLIVLALSTFSLPRVRRATSVAWRLLNERHPTYWGAEEIMTYLRSMLGFRQIVSGRSLLERIILHLSDGLMLSGGDLSNNTAESLEYLRHRIAATFPYGRVVEGSSVRTCLDTVTSTEAIESSVIFNDASDTVKIATRAGGIFIAHQVSIPQDSVGRPSSMAQPMLTIAFGVLCPPLDTTEAALVETGLRVILGQYQAGRVDAAARAHRVDLEKLAAVAQTTQMLAHDVRKPFSMLKALLRSLQLAQLENVGEKNTANQVVADLAGRHLPMVDKAMRSVNVMLQDILDVSRPLGLHFQAADLVDLVESSLLNFFSGVTPRTIQILSQFRHRSAVKVDPDRFERAFENLVANAWQAAGSGGSIAIESEALSEGTPGPNGRTYRSPMVIITLTNSGEPIPANIQDELFVPFGATGKRQGSGLGLAIVHRIIAAHGGDVWLSRSDEAGTIFQIAIPTYAANTETAPRNAISIQIQPPSVHVSRSSDWPQIDTAWHEKALSKRVPEGQPTASAEHVQLRHLQDRLARTGAGALKVVALDDEALYLQTLQQQTSFLDGRTGAIEFTPFQKDPGEAFWRAWVSQKNAIAVLDLDLGRGDLQGLTITRNLRAYGFHGLICIATNRSPMDYQSAALAAGADVFISKPLTLEHLAQLMERALGHESDQLESSRLNGPIPNKG